LDYLYLKLLLRYRLPGFA